MTHPNEGHKFNRYCLKHGHDWQYIGWNYKAYNMEFIKVYQCSICGARQTMIKPPKKRAELFSVPCYNASSALERLE